MLNVNYFSSLVAVQNIYVVLHMKILTVNYDLGEHCAESALMDAYKIFCSIFKFKISNSIFFT